MVTCGYWQHLSLCLSGNSLSLPSPGESELAHTSPPGHCQPDDWQRRSFCPCGVWMERTCVRGFQWWQGTIWQVVCGWSEVSGLITTPLKCPFLVSIRLGNQSKEKPAGLCYQNCKKASACFFGNACNRQISSPQWVKAAKSPSVKSYNYWHLLTAIVTLENGFLKANSNNLWRGHL